MTTRDKFIEDLKTGGYIPGDLSTLPSDISEADRKKVEQYEADQANERMKNTQGQKPELQTFHTQLNPNQYGFAEKAAVGDEDKPAKVDKTDTPKPEPKVDAPKIEPAPRENKNELFGGKGDHDGVNGPGGAKKP